MSPNRLHLVIAVALAATACGKSSPSSAPTGPRGLVGIALPTELSAVPPRAAAVPHAARAALTLATLPDAATDYGKVSTRKHVEERALSQFDILNTIFNAIGQTYYADPANVNAGPYVAIVSWFTEDNGTQSKTLQRWIVDSTRQDAQSDNLVRVWMPEMQMGGNGGGDSVATLVQANFVIKQAPVQNADGSYSDFGAWRLDVDAPNYPGFHFAATAAPDPVTGHSIVKVFQENPGNDGATKGILSKGATSGFGQVWFPEWANCNSQSCLPEHVTAVYAYDSGTVVLKKGADLATASLVAKDRGDVADIVNRYALFDAATGADASAGKKFGFSFSYIQNGEQRWGGYGAWQGRHSLWTNGQQLAAGVTVTRADHARGSAAETYTTSPVYKGLLVKRTLAPTTIDQVAGAIAQTNVSYLLEMKWLGDAWWTNCNVAMPDLAHCTTPAPGDTRPAAAPYTGLDRFAYDPSNTWRRVNLTLCDQAPTSLFCGPVVYMNTGVPGFYKVAMGAPQPNSPPPMPAPAQPLQRVDPSIGSWLQVNGSENVYISYTGQGWVQKKIASFDPGTSTLAFDPTGDSTFVLETGREYNLSDMGVNHIVTFDGTSYAVKVEQQSVANPLNVASFLQGVSYFKQAWGNGTTYTFNATLKLVVGTPGQGEQAQAGSAVTTQIWGLTAYDANNNNLATQFNWEYPQDGMNNGGMGVQQFLVGSNGAPVVLDDPIRLMPEQLANEGGIPRTYSLQFDGSWVGGLPNLWNELQTAQFNVTPTIQAEVVSIPANKVFTDAADSTKTYLFKPLEVSEYLVVLSPYSGTLTTDAAAALDLSTVPTWQDSHMGSPPTNAELKYADGKPVSE